MFLEQGARNLFNRVAANKNGLSLHDRDDAKLLDEGTFLEQLISTGLVERTGPHIRLSKLGDLLHLERALSGTES
jgi:hypothetical protein